MVLLSGLFIIYSLLSTVSYNTIVILYIILYGPWILSRISIAVSIMSRSVQDLFVHSPDIDLSLVSAERHAEAIKMRSEQLKHWEISELNLTSIRPLTIDSKIRFEPFECFIDAVKKHDLDYVRSFLRSGQDINGPIVDGLTAIHQVCI